MWRLAVLLACALAGCGPDCVPSADIELTLVPAAGVDPDLVAKLRIGISIDDGPTRVAEVTPAHRFDRPSAILLHPDSPPPAKYDIAITVEALDAAEDVLEIGGVAQTVVPNGCNRLQAVLAPLPLVDGGDGMVVQPFDLLSPPPDLTCTGLDEDGDGRPNSCDLCPADHDPDPVDSDGDGLPDACDPDENRVGNEQVYFDPFDVNSGHWNGMFSIMSSYLDVATQAIDQPIVTTNGVDALPVNVRVETFILAPFLEGPGQPPFYSDAGLFLGSSPNPGGPNTSGMLCTINHGPSGDTVDLNYVQNGQLQAPTSQPFQFGTNVLYRMRLTQHGATYTCEVVQNAVGDASANPTTTNTVTAPAAPTGSQFIALHAWHIEAHFQSVVAESVLP